MMTAAMKLKDTCSWKKRYDQPDSILKSRDITLPKNVCLVKAIYGYIVSIYIAIYTVVIYGSESWTIKKLEH